MQLSAYMLSEYQYDNVKGKQDRTENVSIWAAAGNAFLCKQAENTFVVLENNF